MSRFLLLEAGQTNQLGNSSKIMVDGVLITTIVIDYSVSTVGMVGEEERERERKSKVLARLREIRG